MTPAQTPPGRIETLNGIQLYFEVHGTGEPLLLLHGFSGSSQDWAATVTEWRTESSSSYLTCEVTAARASCQNRSAIRTPPGTCSRSWIT